MRIIKFKKLSGGRYKTITDEEELILFEDVIIKFNLLSIKEIDLKLLEQILKENKYYEILNISIKYIETKMRSKYELISYLEKKEIEPSIINKVILELEKLHLLNDIDYIKAFVNDKINLSNDGPLKIKAELLKKDIEENEIDVYLNSFDENIWISKIEKIISKKSKTNKNKSNLMLKKKIKNDLYLLGYPDYLLSDIIDKINVNDEKSLKVEFNKSLKKLSKKYTDDKLKYMLKLELLKKGFLSEQIDELILYNDF